MYNPLSPETIEQIKDKLGSDNFWIGIQNFLKIWKNFREKSLKIKIYDVFRKKIIFRNIIKYHDAYIQTRETKKY